MLNVAVCSRHSRHFQVSAGAVLFQIFPNPDRTHIFSNTVCIWGLMVHKHMYGANIQTIVAAVLWDNCACLCPVVLLHTLDTRTKCPFQRQWSGGGSGVQPSPPKSQTKVCPCCCEQNMPF